MKPSTVLQYVQRGMEVDPYQIGVEFDFFGGVLQGKKTIYIILYCLNIEDVKSVSVKNLHTLLTAIE